MLSDLALGSAQDGVAGIRLIVQQYLPVTQALSLKVQSGQQASREDIRALYRRCRGHFVQTVFSKCRTIPKPLGQGILQLLLPVMCSECGTRMRCFKGTFPGTRTGLCGRCYYKSLPWDQMVDSKYVRKKLKRKTVPPQTKLFRRKFTRSEADCHNDNKNIFLKDQVDAYARDHPPRRPKKRRKVIVDMTQ